MISGTVSPSRDAMVRLTLFNVADRSYDFSGIIDTGFNGYLTLPPDVIKGLQLTLLRYTRITLADGTKRVAPVYKVTVLWDGVRVIVSATETDGDVLIGMSLMYGFELTMPVLDGATFTLKSIEPGGGQG